MPIFDTVAQLAYRLVASQSEAPGLTALDIAWADRSDAATSSRDDHYRLAEWYYTGQQRDVRAVDLATVTIPLTAPAYRAAQNVTAVVVDVMTERLTVTGFTVEGPGATPGQDTNEDGDNAVAARLWRWWQQNRMDETQNTIHAQALIKGDSYVFVDYDPRAGRPRFTWNDALQVTPVYDAQHQLTQAYKTWTERYTNDQNLIQVRFRITKYTRGAIEKFARDGMGGRWQVWPHDLDADGNPDGGVIDWTDAAGQPLGIPIIHYRNKARGDDFGRSEIADVIAAQDNFNLRHAATTDAIDLQGSPQRYVIGGSPPAGGWPTGPGQVWTITGIGTTAPTAGQFAAGNVGELQDATDRQLKLIAAMSRTPLHLIWPDGGLPSGEALKTAESGLVAKCQDRAITFGNAWEDVMRLAMRLHNTFSAKPPLAEDVTISAVWGSFETRSDLSDAQVTTLIADHISAREFLRRCGYSEEQIDKIQAEKDAEPSPMMQAVNQQVMSQPPRQVANAVNPISAGGSGETLKDGVRGT